MRTALVPMALFCLVSTARGQTIDPTTEGWVNLRASTGPAIAGWKVSGPSGPSDYYSVNLGGLATGFAAHAVLMDGSESRGTPGAWRELAFRSSNALGDPDTSPAGLIVAQTNAPMAAWDFFGDEYGWVIPVTTLGTDVHATCTWYNGDSHLWINSDNDGTSAGRSAWSADAYATAGNALSGDVFLGAMGFPSTAEGSLLVNGGASDSVTQGGTVCLTFTACASNVPTALYMFAPIWLGPLIPLPLTVTGQPWTGGPLPNQWTICVTTDCSTPIGGPFSLGTVYLDPCDLKPGGKPKAKMSNTGDLTILCSRSCWPSCFGRKDDERFDGTVWVVQLPAGPSDYFSVNHGSPDPCYTYINNLTGVEIATWDMCGTGATWASVGIYPDNAAMPGTPDVANPLGVDPNPSFGPGTFDTGYPATFYGVPSFAASTTVNYHAVAQWSPGESCIAVAADTTGDPFTCATRLGGSTMTSAMSMDGYATGAVYVNYANWMMQIKWN